MRYALGSYKENLMFLPSQRQDLPAHFTALANPTRLRLLVRLAEVAEESVNDLALFLRISQPRVSWHLRILRLGGAVKVGRDGRQVYCSLDRDGIERRQLELRRIMDLNSTEVTT